MERGIKSTRTEWHARSKGTDRPGYHQYQEKKKNLKAKTLPPKRPLSELYRYIKTYYRGQTNVDLRKYLENILGHVNVNSFQKAIGQFRAAEYTEKFPANNCRICGCVQCCMVADRTIECHKCGAIVTLPSKGFKIKKGHNILQLFISTRQSYTL